jgi:hypothetical protein
MGMEETAAIRDIDRDSLYILPLAIIPFETPGLGKARMVKNVGLESVIEVFTDEKTGSGQVRPEDLHQVFSGLASSDRRVIKKLEKLPTFDVYSLRILLRQQKIPVNDYSELRLSERKVRDLDRYMKRFTRPLALQLFNGGASHAEDDVDLIALLRNADAQRVRRNLQSLAKDLDLMLDELPKFLEDYGDIFLSVAYFQECLDAIQPIIRDFLGSLGEICSHVQLRHDKELMETCRQTQANVVHRMRHVAECLKIFEINAENLWGRLSADHFRSVKTLVHNSHTTLGGHLCALTVKMDAWSRRFPTPDSGGPHIRAEFICSNIRQGLVSRDGAAGPGLDAMRQPAARPALALASNG